MIRGSRIFLLLAFVAIAGANPAMAQHETRSWKGMDPCKSDKYVYFAGQIWVDNDPNRPFAVTAVGPAIMQGAKRIIEQAGMKSTIHLRDLELVDGFISATGHWALLRTAHPEVLQAKLPKCTIDLASPPGIKKGCPAWAYPHTSIAGDTATGVVGEPIAGRTLEEVREHATGAMKTLMTITLDADVVITENGYSMTSRHDAGIENLEVQSQVCDNMYWVMGIGRRAKAPKK